MSLVVALFAREPVPGQTKTRLIPALGAARACALYEAFLEDVASTALQLRGLHPDVALSLWAADASPGQHLRERADRWGMELFTQQGSTLGDRMSHALTVGIARYGAALIVGTDVPTLPLRLLVDARAALRPAADAAPSTAPWCLGPAADGGYFVVGACVAPPSFDGVRMGTRDALADTVAANHDRPAHRLAPWYDVDTRHDLRILQLHLGVDPSAAPATAALLSGWRDGVLG